MQRERFSFLEAFAKVSGHPEVTERQFGTVVLDMMFAGREIKTYIPLTEVAKSLEAILTNTTSDIESKLKLEITKIEDQLLAFHNQIHPVLEIKEASTEDKMYLADEDAFLYFDGDTIVLTDEQELTLKANAYSIKTFLNREGEAAFKKFLSAPLAKLKLILAVFANEKYNMILTEEAWQRIEKTNDRQLIKILLAKLIIDDANKLINVKFHSEIRKAIFENKLISQRILNCIEDESLMKE